MIEWLKMGGHGYYIWASYGMLAVALAIELYTLRRRRRAARALIDAVSEERTWR